MSADPAALRAPEPLTARHDVSRFTNGIHPSLDQWLRQKARASEDLSARTYVVCSTNEPNRVVGYFAISTAVVQRIALPSAKLRRGMPEQVPLLLIGRLAVNTEWRGRGFGSALLVDALRHPKLREREAWLPMRSTMRPSPFTRVTVLSAACWATGSC